MAAILGPGTDFKGTVSSIIGSTISCGISTAFVFNVFNYLTTVSI